MWGHVDDPSAALIKPQTISVEQTEPKSEHQNGEEHHENAMDLTIEDVQMNDAPAKVVFIEFFAGQGGLTAAVSKLGIECDLPHDVADGGADFSKDDDVNTVKDWLGTWRASGYSLILHFAPPCSTFSRARDRSWKTRLRSTQRPQGLMGKGAACKTANKIARNTLNVVEWAVDELHARVTVENPQSSYLWLYLDFREGLWYEDVIFSPCMFGSDFFKPTRVRAWGWRPRRLDKKCTRVGKVHACGKTTDNPHTTLEFGGMSTAVAAAYAEGVCVAWAEDILELSKEMATDDGAVQAAHLTGEGRVRRHLWRGSEDKSSRERRDREDAESTAGMRNPAALASSWPELFDGLASLRQLFTTFRSLFPAFQGLAGCCGNDPERQPPSDAELANLRRCMAILFAKEPSEFAATPLASPWIPGVAEALREATGDPDVALIRWLRDGAPMGLAKDIEVGGHFPKVDLDAELSVAELDLREPCLENHPSFMKKRGDEDPPGIALLEEQVNAGFAYLFKDMAQAMEVLGDKVHPAPLGNIEKIKDDGSIKDRLIQDQTANFVNLAVRLPERQVLPRGVDHGRDLAVLSENLKEGEVVQTLVLDFKDAFMSLAIHRAERRFNCAHSTCTVKRTRAALFEDEVVAGTFVVWKVLGFGGRPNPLVFSRAASLACRVAQGLLGRDRVEGVGVGRLQLYVDDPVLTVRGTPAECTLAIDLVIMVWLAMGIPLSWKKGALYDMATPHRWIGIVYSVVAEGALMRLPDDYIKDLLDLLAPACAKDNVMNLGDLEVLVGKAARVAHVVPTARPFVAGLWGAMAAARREAVARTRPSLTRISTRRFCYSASWVAALLKEDGSCPLDLERLVTPRPPQKASASGAHIEFDASVYGGGAVLKNEAGEITEYICIVWSEEDAPHLGVYPGDTKNQSFYEFLTLLLSLLVWGDAFVDHSVAILGDNVGALTSALSLKGRGSMLAVARELSWRQARRRWAFEVGHLPSEHNSVADALSRVADPAGKAWPSWALTAAEQRKCPNISDLWRAAPA